MSVAPLDRLSTWSRFVKLEHTLFSLPMLFAGAWLAAGGFPGWRPILLILLAGFGARVVAMGLNRIIDRTIDGQNPRTRSRELPAGAMSVGEARGIVAAGLILYLVAAAALGGPCLLLSPLPLLVFLGYPYLKRVTPLAHLGVGLGLAAAPLGAWMAIRQTFAGSLPALLLGAFTFCWVAGFDVIYATLDTEFDRGAGLHSLPSRFGNERALQTSAAFHLLAFLTLLLLRFAALSGGVADALLALIGILLFLEHRKGREIESAFFHINAALGFVVLAFIVAGAR